MKYIILAFVLMTGFAGMAQDADALIGKVKAKLDDVRDYRAEAVMKTDVSFMKVPESSVTIYYKNPDQFKIKKQDGISIVPKGGVNINLGSLFAGDNYTAVSAGTGTVDNKPVAVVKLLPLDEKSNVVVATLYIADKDALVLKAVISTRDNGTYEMLLSYGRYAGNGLPDKVVFIFDTKDYKLPKGLAFDYDTGEKPSRTTGPGDGKGKVQIIYSSYVINKGLDPAVFL